MVFLHRFCEFRLVAFLRVSFAFGRLYAESICLYLRAKAFVVLTDMEGGSNGGSARFELLNETNYFTWKYRVEMQLIRKDLWGIVRGSKPRPLTGARAQAAWDKR